MSAPQAVVDAVMEALGCQPYADPYPYCRTSHGRSYVWTDRGCGIAVAAADAAHKADLPHLLAPIESLLLTLSDADETQVVSAWEVAEDLRHALASIKGQPS